MKNRVKDSVGSLGFWRSSQDGKPSNGGSGEERKVGTIEEVEGPLSICSNQALHATIAPWKWKGERLWVVALYGEIQRQDDKMGALKREILAEIKPNPWKESE